MTQLKAFNNGLVKLDRSKLKTVIESYNNLQETDYTTSSWQMMKTIVDAAKLVYENVSLNQVDIDNAIATLNEINLIKRGNTKALAKLLQEYDEADYTTSTWTEVAAVFKTANAMVVDNSDVSQEQVDAMVATVQEATAKLIARGNTKALAKLLQEYDEADYTTSTWTEVAAVFKTANAMVVDNSDISQEQVDAMVATVQEATAKLIVRGNTKALAKLLQEYDEADYTTSTWTKVAAVFKTANAMVVDNSDISQEQVDAMVATVQEAAMKLVKLGDSKNLENVINKITEAIKELDQANYVQDSWNKLQTTIRAAKELLGSKDVSQSELDDMLASLNQAYDALKPIVVKPSEEIPVNNPTNGKSEKTGDDINLISYAGLFGIALLGLICRKKFD